ncbi:hypothetical protein GC176_07805 [bacterium]|nr:hypothetical protein [bacterium]
MLERVTDRARKVFSLAHEHAKALGHGAVHTGHVVLGLGTEGDGVAANVLRFSHVDLNALAARVAVQALVPGEASEEMIALDSASLHAVQMLNHNYCGTEHLLFGICLLPSLSGASALTEVGASLEHLGDEILKLLGHFDLHYSSLLESFNP